MKKYSNIPLKERKRNADKMFRHEVKLEEINEKRAEKEKELSEKEYYEAKCRLFEQYEQLHKDAKSDKERQEDEAFARLKEVAERGENGT